MGNCSKTMGNCSETMESPEESNSNERLLSDSQDETSEDKEFLVLINDPQVRNRLKKQFEEETELVQEVVKAQVVFLGSEQLYNRVNTNLKDLKFEPFFAEAQYKLFAWRVLFFMDEFCSPINDDGTVNQTHAFDTTIPFQVTQNFDEVITLACSKGNISTLGSSPVNDEELPHNPNYKYDKDMFFMDSSMIEKDEIEKKGFSFGDIAHLIVAVYSTSPPSLLEAAMQTVLLHNIALHDAALSKPCHAVCCTDLQQIALHGLYTPADEKLPENLLATGLELFKNLRVEFSRELNSRNETRVPDRRR
eukprot:GFUD01024164.1.p1 GENE.GFUD01024164.1~~GFUD01024164.1.p1  ORF type:complete len:306 (-),score=81.78 GFUD01024164.1:124-1041(-)